MAYRRITMQDIASACGLSRNTVSKIFNGRGAVPEATCRMVLQKAQELGYHLAPSAENVPPAAESRNVALLTSHMPTDYHFGAFLIPAFTEYLSRAGYTLTMHELSQDELRQRRLPAHLSLVQTAGILSIELFDRGYLEMLCGSGIPVIFADAYAGACTMLRNCDFISMENVASTMALASRAITAGARRLGFVGDRMHCNSFYERWLGFCSALDSAGIPLDKTLCILSSDAEPYNDAAWLLAKLRGMPLIPDAFICANDFIALHLMTALKQLGLSVPKDVMVTGFDGIPLTAVVEPSLTTVQIPNTDIGRIAAELLLKRIENPDRPFSNTYIKTTPIWRSSTR